jgi:hypothetical protein
MAKLIGRHHDAYHVHAIVGLLTLLHFFWRFGYSVVWRGDRAGAGFGTNMRTDAISLIMLTLPNLTSLLFKGVPTMKPNDGFTIWKEYRLHAAIFAARSWIMLTVLCYQRHFAALPYMPIFRGCLATLTMCAATLATASFPTQTSTIRGFYSGGWAVFAAGFAQYLGTAGTLLGTEYDFGLHWLAITVIQLNAFFMTLRKKRIVGPNTVQALYSLLLLSVTWLFLITSMLTRPPVSLLDERLHFVYLAATAYSLRRAGLGRFSAWGLALAFAEGVGVHRF